MTVRTREGIVTLRRSTLVSYSAMALGPAVFSLAVNVMLPQLYAKELGLALTDIGIALMLIRIFDSVSDQIVGLLSDRTRTRFGARKPWIVLGIIMTLVACEALFNPPARVSLTYFVLWRILYDLGWTLYNVAYTAWGAELSRNYADRSKINGYSGMSANAGVVLKNILPIGLYWLGVTKTSAYSMQVFGYMFWIMLPIIVIATAYSVFGTPNGQAVSRQAPDFRGLFQSVKSNKPFWSYFAGFLIASFGGGMFTLLFTFYDSYLKLGPWYPYLMMGFGVVTVVSIPLWVKIADKIGKHRAYAVAMFMTSLVIQSFWLIDPAHHSRAVVALLGAAVLFFVALSTACAFVAPGAMLADVVDYGTWRTGVARAGSYFAFHSLITKVAMAVGGGVAFMLLGFFHYSVRPGVLNTPSAKAGLLFTVLLAPGILNVISGAIIWRFPLDARRHAILRRRIASRLVPDPEQPQGAPVEGTDLLIGPLPAA